MPPLELREYQTLLVEHALDFLANAGPGDRQLYASPTGTGKSVVETTLQERLRSNGVNAWLTTPRVEIISGMLDKAGVDTSAWGEQRILDEGWDRGITTPVRLRNAMLRGTGPEPQALIVDEAHHDTAETGVQLHLLTGRCPAVGLTATPFRGTPRGTLAFREAWGEPIWALTLREAVEMEYVAFPECRIVPLVDDDTLTVSNGDFSVASASGAILSRMDAVVGLLGKWEPRPSMVSMPGTEAALTLHSACKSAGIPTVLVTGDTLPPDRRTAFTACVSGQAILIQINVVSEGVDLPIRRLLDCSPTLSPVRWLQQLGRITRPTRRGEGPPQYVCTNRNLLRHAYLLEGLLPRAVLVEAQTVFPGSTARSTTGRVVGLEAVGRLKPAPLPLVGGLEAFLYAMSSVSGAVVTQYAVIVHPEHPEPLWAFRRNERGEDGVTAQYGRWQRCESPADLTGFASLTPSAVTEKQLKWWTNAARRYGLDPTIEPNRKQFAALPVLSDLNWRAWK